MIPELFVGEKIKEVSFLDVIMLIVFSPFILVFFIVAVLVYINENYLTYKIKKQMEKE